MPCQGRFPGSTFEDPNQLNQTEMAQSETRHSDQVIELDLFFTGRARVRSAGGRLVSDGVDEANLASPRSDVDPVRGDPTSCVAIFQHKGNALP
jgi:hypothetical protein